MGYSTMTTGIQISSTKRRRVGVKILVAAAFYGGFVELAMGDEKAKNQFEQELTIPVQLAQAEQVYDFDIPSQPLADAFAEFSAQTGIRVQGIDVAADAQPSGVTGTYSPGQALQILLSGSGLTYRFADSNTVTVEEASLKQDGGPVVLDDGVVQLEEVTVTAGRVETLISNIPGSVSVLEEEEIRDQITIARDLSDVLGATVPGFSEDQLRPEGPTLRGRPALVLINGAPVNQFLRAGSGIDLDAIPPEAIGRVEVARGASAAYGFGASGGIVSITTRRSRSEDLLLTSRASASFNVNQPGGSWETFGYQSAEGAAGPFDYYVGAQVGYDGSTFDPDGDRTPIVFEADPAVGYSFNSNLGLDLGEGRSLRLVGNYNRRDVKDVYSPMNGIYRVRFADAMREEDSIDDGFDENYGLTLTYKQEDLFGSLLKLEGFYYDFERKQGGLSFAPAIDVENNEWLGVRSSLATPLDFIHDGTSITYGFDFSRNRFFQPFFDRDTGAFQAANPDVTQDSYAGFVQIEIPIGDFLITGGARHEEFRADAESTLNFSGPDDAPAEFEGGDILDFDLTLFNVGLVYFLTDHTELYAGFSQGADITQLGRAATAAESAALINPEPAKSDSYEIGARGFWQNTEASIAAFYTDSDLASDLTIDPENPGGLLIPLREPRKIWGVEVTLDHRFNRQWGVGAIGTWQEGQRENTDTGATEKLAADIIVTPQTTLYVDYAPFTWWRNKLQALYIFERDAGVEGVDGPVDNDPILDFLAEFDALGGNLSLGVENLLNHEYASVLSQAFNDDFFWFPQEGTRVTLAYRLEW